MSLAEHFSEADVTVNEKWRLPYEEQEVHKEFRSK